MSIDRAVDPWALRHRLSPVLPFSIGAYFLYKQYWYPGRFCREGPILAESVNFRKCLKMSICQDYGKTGGGIHLYGYSQEEKLVFSIEKYMP
jgi:hypothetical protein